MLQSVLIVPSRQTTVVEQVPTNNLPAQLVSLIGREKEVEAVYSLLQHEDVRLLTLVGTGGCGKTSLGLEVAKKLLPEFANCIYFVSLASIRDPNLVIPTIMQTLGLRETAEVGNSSLLKSLQSYLRHKQVLLFLDNFEHVLTAAPLLVELLQACLHVKILVTSRAVLRLRAEHEFLVSPLVLPDLEQSPDIETLLQNAAVSLLMQRAQAIRSDFTITNANAHAIAEICIRLDGLPLALELAAARLKLLSPQELLTRLKRRLQILTGGACDMPVRQQTLRNTLMWSYNLLDAQEQQLFRRLSVFAGGFTWQAAKAVCADISDSATQVLDGVTSLLEKNLLQKKEVADSDSRLVMLETVREYALECMAMQDEEAKARYAHAEYYISLVEKAESECGQDNPLAWSRRLKVEQGNLCSACDWMLERKDKGGVARLRKVLTYLDRVAPVAGSTALVGVQTMKLQKAAITQAPLFPPQPLEQQSPLGGTITCQAGLTKREITILCLVAQALSSAQIAERLSIKPLTVNTHVRSAYNKLGITSRSAATRYVIEQKLI